jgi:hypothetical protein
MPKRTGATGGEWPIVDIIMLSDYPSPDQALTASKVQINNGNECLRIHMDVRYAQADNIEKRVQNGDLLGAYNAILKYNDDGQPHPRANALLAAALGLLDNAVIPGSGAKPAVARRGKPRKKR